MFGRWDAEEFLDEIGAVQFDWWRAFSVIEPFGPWADDQRNAMGLAMQAARYSKEKVTTQQYMTCKLKVERRSKKLPAKVLKEMMTAALGKPNG